MGKLTIKDAVVSVLKKRNSPLTVREIYDEIIEKNLFKFNTSSPENVLKAAIRKNCFGVKSQKQDIKKIFKIVGSKFALNDDEH
jgi:hypothetical protein